MSLPTFGGLQRLSSMHNHRLPRIAVVLVEEDIDVLDRWFAGDQLIDSLVEYLLHRTGQEDLAIEGLVHDFVVAAMQSLSTIV